MPRKTPRTAQAEALVRAYTSFRQMKAYRTMRRRGMMKGSFERVRLYRRPFGLSASDSDMSLDSSSSSDTDSAASGDDIHMHSDSSLSVSSVSSVSSDDDDDSEWESVDSGEGEGEGDAERLPKLVPKAFSDDVPLSRPVHAALTALYASRYHQARERIPKAPSHLAHCLSVYKVRRPDLFRQKLRIDPHTFDELCADIRNDPVFHNNSNNEQLAVEVQLGIALYRFGRDGNGASVQDVADYAGVGKGTVLLCTRRVMTACLRKEFREAVNKMPRGPEKEKAKKWVKEHSCFEWRDGWLMVDGTLIRFYDRPFWFGPSYFDRKCGYSLNFQVINTPDLRIRDYSFGRPGSTHDATAWEDTNVYNKHDRVLKKGEWIWADSAYPLETWLVAPYKKPLRDLPDNEKFNNFLSMVRIRSEHAIGFLKGRFQSLKHLRLNVWNAGSHKFATYWVITCITLHNYAMASEAHAKAAEGDAQSEQDPFIAEGLSTSSDSEDNARLAPAARNANPSTLSRARAFRESLKAKLFEALERRRQEEAEEEGSAMDEDHNLAEEAEEEYDEGGQADDEMDMD